MTAELQILTANNAAEEICKYAQSKIPAFFMPDMLYLLALIEGIILKHIRLADAKPAA